MAQTKKQDLKQVLPPKKQRSKRIQTSMEFSMDAVKRAADVLVGFGFPREVALELVAAQLHANLVELNLGAKLGGKK